ncbi:MAG: nucleotidyl transferase AbiEii/AbiGii toxin family protein [Deltaproteobacteria bacterium]|nr:nucleotidyl transferase AbiEii/AbiGii toxin family protein [Deltaproteobacteria bacterium]
MANVQFSYPHHTDPDIFREALSYSEASTGFTSRLIEKDYYASLILQYFFSGDTTLVFKGGTCLSKIYADFYRLSEDLDLVIPVAADTPRNRRRFKMDPVKILFRQLPGVIPEVSVSKEFRGHNESRQYIGYAEYPSAVMDKQERIKIEMREAYAEKVRAAFTRKDPAIRDLFDLFHAARKMKLNLEDHDFLMMVRRKINVPGNTPVDVSLEYRRELIRQLEGELKPVLRSADFDHFNIDETLDLIARVANMLADNFEG